VKQGVLEEWGGDPHMVPVSAKKGVGARVLGAGCGWLEWFSL
jgi:hypothetical protein